MLHRLTLALLLLAAFAAPVRARAQQPAAPTLTVNQVDARGYPDVLAVVTVLDTRGVPVPGLVASQFQAFEGQDQLQIGAVKAALNEDLPLSVVVVIDISGSMAGARIEQAKQAATAFVQSLGPRDQAAVVAFSDRVTSVVPPTSDRLQLTNGIAGLQVSGGTALYEAVQTSAFAAASSTTTRRAVVVLTDGENETQASQATREGSLEIIRGASVPIFTIGVGATTDEAYLREVAAATTGRYAPATPETIGSVYSDIATLLRNQYVVTIRAKKPADGKDAAIQLIALAGNAPATGLLSFKRGSAAAPPVVVTPATTSTAPLSAKKASSNTLAFVFAGAVVAVLLVIAAVFFLRWRRHRRLLREQLKIVAPNVRQAAAQPLPSRHGPAVASSNGAVAVATQVGTGRLTEKGGEGRVFDLGGGPVVIGSSPRASNIVLDSDDVAPEHTRLWLRDGRYLLHHVGGMSRKTLVGGQPADWVVLEAGDELQVGRWKFVFEEHAPEGG